MFDGFGHKTFGYDIADEMMNLIKTIAIDSENNSSSRYLIVETLNRESFPTLTDTGSLTGFVSSDEYKNYVPH